MDEITQLAYKHADLVTLMLKDQGIHEGLWQLQVTFGLAAGNAGPNPDDISPAAIVGVQKIGLVRAAPGTPLTNMLLDAAEVNPKS